MTTGYRADLEQIEQALGLPRWTVKTVERRASGDYAIVLDTRRAWRLIEARSTAYGDIRWLNGRRVLRISPKKIHGYRSVAPLAAPRDRRARERANRRRFAWWAFWNWSPDLPLVEQALTCDDLRLVDDFRAAVIRASHRGTVLQALRELEEAS